MNFNLLFRFTSWIPNPTSYLTSIINTILPPSSGGDGDVGDGSSNDQALNNHQELGVEDDFPVSSDELISEQSVGLPPKRKLYFYVFYISFLILYLVLVLVTTCTYPLRPEHSIKIHLPVFEKESVNATEELKQSVYLDLWLNNRNKLASVMYDDLRIIIFYLDPRSNTRIYFASSIASTFYQQDSKVNALHMPAPGLPGLLQLQSMEYTSVLFLVDLEFAVRFDCKWLCKHKHDITIETDTEFWF